MKLIIIIITIFSSYCNAQDICYNTKFDSIAKEIKTVKYRSKELKNFPISALIADYTFYVCDKKNIQNIDSYFINLQKSYEYKRLERILNHKKSNPYFALKAMDLTIRLTEVNYFSKVSLIVSINNLSKYDKNPH